MSLFGSLMADVEDENNMIFGSHMRHVRHMNNMMNSLFSDPFGMFGGESPLALMGPRRGNSLMPFIPQMPTLGRLFQDLNGGNMGAGSSFSSSTVVMSSCGPNGKPQVYSSSSSTKIGPNGVKETRKTLEDSRTGTKKMSIGHHIGDRAHVIEREQNVYTGDNEERQEFINLEEEEAEHFDREFQVKAGMGASAGAGTRPALPAPRTRAPSLLALAAPPAHTHTHTHAHSPASAEWGRPARRAPRPAASPLAAPRHSAVREVYGGSHPQRHRSRPHRNHLHSPNQ